MATQCTEHPPEKLLELLKLHHLMSLVRKMEVRHNGDTQETTVSENKAIREQDAMIALILSTREHIEKVTTDMSDKNTQNYLIKFSRDWLEFLKKLQLIQLESNLESLVNKNTMMDRFYDKFEPMKELGSGSSGRVIMAREKETQSMCALKQIRIDKNNEDDLVLVQREIKGLVECRHPGLVFFYHSWFERPESLPEEGHFRPFTEEDQGSSLEESQSVSGPGSAITKSDENITGSNETSRKRKLTVNNCLIPPMRDISGESWASDSTDSKHSCESTTTSDSAGEIPKTNLSSDILKLKFQTDSNMEVLTKSDRESASSKEADSRGTKKEYMYLFISMELCKGGTLGDWLTKYTRDGDRHLGKMKSWMKDLIITLAHIHEKGYIHRDIKPDNIFFYQDSPLKIGPKDSKLKIGDFGLVTSEFIQSPLGDNVPSEHTSYVGTKAYMSREQLDDKPYTSKVDVYALGHIYCEMVYPFKSYQERYQTFSALQRGKATVDRKNQVVESLGDNEQKMIYWMTESNPDDRPTCRKLLESKYFDVAPYMHASVSMENGQQHVNMFCSAVNEQFDYY